ncbi:MAG: hypothetical protein AB4060_22345 [Crocosphaera sp.]
MNQKNGDETQSLQRLKRISDGIFMLAMTFLSWWYASRNDRLIDPSLEKKESVKIARESLIQPLVSLFSIIVSLINPTYWEWNFFLIFPLYLVL